MSHHRLTWGEVGGQTQQNGRVSRTEMFQDSDAASKESELLRLGHREFEFRTESRKLPPLSSGAEGGRTASGFSRPGSRLQVAPGLLEHTRSGVTGGHRDPDPSHRDANLGTDLEQP